MKKIIPRVIKQTTFSIILPVMNQADHIEKVIRSHHQLLTKQKFSFEIIVVVNGTTDNSYQICEKLSNKLTNVRVYELKLGGYGRGVLYGLKKAHGQYLCYINSARAHSDELLKCLQLFLDEPKGIFHAVRVKRDRLLRKITSLIYITGCWLVTGVSSTDINGTPKIFSQNIFKRLKLNFVDSMIDLQFLERAKKLKIPVKEVPIYNNDRFGGKSTSNFKTVFRLFKELIVYSIKRNR